MPDDDEDDDIDENISQDISKPDALLERLQKATRDIGLKLQFQPLIKYSFLFLLIVFLCLFIFIFLNLVR